MTLPVPKSAPSQHMPSRLKETAPKTMGGSTPTLDRIVKLCKEPKSFGMDFGAEFESIVKNAVNAYRTNAIEWVPICVWLRNWRQQLQVAAQLEQRIYAEINAKPRQ